MANLATSAMPTAASTDPTRAPDTGWAHPVAPDTRRGGDPNTVVVPGDQAHEGAAENPWPRVPGYEILGELGRGSMGVVYKARQLGLGRLVALKMVRTGAGAGEEALGRFVEEARVVAALQHPNIVQIYDINLRPEQPYFSMELVEGGTLAERLGGRPQPVLQAADLVQALARAIHVAHERGIVHRDLKPANVLITAPAAGTPGSPAWTATCPSPTSRPGSPRSPTSAWPSSSRAAPPRPRAA